VDYDIGKDCQLVVRILRIMPVLEKVKRKQSLARRKPKFRGDS
jgi:hypothetical protein